MNTLPDVLRRLAPLVPDRIIHRGDEDETLDGHFRVCIGPDPMDDEAWYIFHPDMEDIDPLLVQGACQQAITAKGWISNLLIHPEQTCATIYGAGQNSILADRIWSDTPALTLALALEAALKQEQQQEKQT